MKWFLFINQQLYFSRQNKIISIKGASIFYIIYYSVKLESKNSEFFLSPILGNLNLGDL